MLLAGLVIFWKWFEIQKNEANEFRCKIKQRSYCSSLIQGENPNWEEIEPKSGCEKFEIVKPSVEECKKMVG